MSFILGILFNWRVWAVVVLTGLFCAFGWKCYTLGEAHVQAEFDAYVSAQAKAELEQEQKDRVTEQGWQLSVRNLTDAYIKQKSDLAASKSNLDGVLRDFETTVAATPPANSCAPGGVDAVARPLNDVLGRCAGTLAKLAEEADGLDAKLVALQGYVRAILLEANKP